MSRSRIFLLSFVLALAASPAYASTISFSPATVSVTKGQTFTVAVMVNPAGTKVYTVKADVSYPAALLEATGFSFASGWMPLSAAGYDSTDNAAGRLVKTGGFPGGFTDTKTLGTITFTAKADGTATVSASNASIAYDAQNKNTVSGTQGSAAVSIGAAPVAAPKPATTPAAQPAAAGAGGGTPAQSAAQTSAPASAGQESETAGATSVPATTSVAAAGVAAGPVAWLMDYWWIVLLALLAALLGFFGYRSYRRRSMY